MACRLCGSSTLPVDLVGLCLPNKNQVGALTIFRGAFSFFVDFFVCCGSCCVEDASAKFVEYWPLAVYGVTLFVWVY